MLLSRFSLRLAGGALAVGLIAVYFNTAPTTAAGPEQVATLPTTGDVRIGGEEPRLTREERALEYGFARFIGSEALSLSPDPPVMLVG